MNPPSRRPRRADPNRSGRAGEQLAAAWLRRRGYRLVAANLRTVHGEIDLLVRRFRTYVAVEVKARADHPAPERLVDGERLQRLRTALLALAPTLRPRPWRLHVDIVAIRWTEDGFRRPEVMHFRALRSL